MGKGSTGQKLKMGISSSILYLLSAISIVFGLIYLLRTDIMPYHHAFLGMTVEELDQLSPKLMSLYLALMKVSGANSFAIGLASVFLVMFPFRQRKAWSWWCLLLLYLSALVPLFFITFNVASQIPDGQSKPPWVLTLAMIALLGAALGISFYKKKPEKSR